MRTRSLLFGLPLVGAALSGPTPVRADARALWQIESTPFFAKAVFNHCDRRFLHAMLPDGANSSNAKWEEHAPGQKTWFIEDQRAGRNAIVAGLLHNDPHCIDQGFKMFDWGFAKEERDGSFGDTAGGKLTEQFHSQSLFVEAVANSILMIQQSPMATQYESKIQSYGGKLHRAARWLIRPDVWDAGARNNSQFTHRYFLVGAALAEAGLVCNDESLISRSRELIRGGIEAQTPDGVNPEKDGYDSSYQAVGLMFAQTWLALFPDDSLAGSLNKTIDRGLRWEETRLLGDGDVDDTGNSRTGPGSVTRSGSKKRLDYSIVVQAFAMRSAATGDDRWQRDAIKVARFKNMIDEA